MNRALAAIFGASAFLGGCASVPPEVNPTVEVWNVQPTTNTDLADVLVAQAFSLASSVLDSSGETNSYPSEDTRSGCLIWCFSYGRTARPAPAISQPVVYYYPVYSEPSRPATRVSTPAPRPAHGVEHKPRQIAHAPAAKPAAPKPSKPTAPSKSNTKKDKR